MVLNSCTVPEALPEGRWKFTCHLPHRLLNDRLYSVESMIVKNSANVLVRIPHCLRFQTHDLERESAWFGKFPGAVRPKMQWTTEPTDGASCVTGQPPTVTSTSRGN